MTPFEHARETYAELGVDVIEAIERTLQVPISIHCWQGDDVRGFEIHEGNIDSGGIMATGNYPGAARNAHELREDLSKVLSLVPGPHRVNLHAIYAETEGKAVSRDQLDATHFEGWMDWAEEKEIGLDFNPTFFAHPLAADGYTLSHASAEVRQFWIRHGKACRRIAAAFASRQGETSVINHWIPDGAKDSPIDRWSPRARLKESLDEMLSETLVGVVDAVESKLFGLGSEDYVVGSFEFYSQYALRTGNVLCLDMGHFHPTETIHDKLSALFQFQDRLLLHVSRPIRWDSDHVVVLNDDLQAVFRELKRGDAFDRTFVALDYFDASINRITAYVTGIRATRKAILAACLEPTDRLRDLERSGNHGSKLALLEEVKTLPFGAVWDELCRRTDVPGRGWIAESEAYERTILASR